MTPDGSAALEVTAQVRKQMLDRAGEWCDRFVLAMRAEGVTDQVMTRVVNRIITGWPDPDEVMSPEDQARVSRAARSMVPNVAPLGRPFDRSKDHDPFCARCQAGTPCP